MAESLAAGAESMGGVRVSLYDLEGGESGIFTDLIEEADGLAFGSPTINADAVKHFDPAIYVMLLIRDYKAKLADAQQRQQKLKNESEFYLNKAKPAGLDSDLRNAAHEIRTQAELIESKQKELMAIREKFGMIARRNCT